MATLQQNQTQRNIQNKVILVRNDVIGYYAGQAYKNAHHPILVSSSKARRNNTTKLTATTTLITTQFTTRRLSTNHADANAHADAGLDMVRPNHASLGLLQQQKKQPQQANSIVDLTNTSTLPESTLMDGRTTTTTTTQSDNECSEFKQQQQQQQLLFKAGVLAPSWSHCSSLYTSGGENGTTTSNELMEIPQTQQDTAAAAAASKQQQQPEVQEEWALELWLWSY